MAREQRGGILHYLRRTFQKPVNDNLTDRQLLERFAHERDENAFTALVRRHGPMILSVCRRVLHDDHKAEDAFQATFIVLARKAASLVWQESIGSWLYAVAFRCASKARVTAARRCFHEQQVTDMPRPGPTANQERAELRSVLDEELTRLPEKYRAPLLLCYLEGKTNAQAAQELGWPLGTVNGRLARGRELLRSRLMRRHLALPSALVATALCESAAPAAPSPALVEATVQAALVSPAAALAAPIASIVEGVLHTMFVAKLKGVAVLFLALGLLGFGGGAYYLQSEGTATARANPAPPPGPAGETSKEREPKSSEPVVKDGLSIQVRPVRAAFALKEPPSFIVTFKNQSKEPIYLYDPNFLWGIDGGDRYFGYHCRVEDLTRGGHWTPLAEVELRVGRPEDSTRLAAGASLEVKFTLKGPTAPLRYRWGGEDGRKDDTFRDFLDKGKYRLLLTANLWDNANGDPQRKHWVGALAAKPVEFEVDARMTPLPRREEKSDPAAAPLQARLVAKTATYTLDLGGQTPDKLRALFTKAPYRVAPAPVPEVDFMLELRNGGDEEFQFLAGGTNPDNPQLSLKLDGPDAVNVVLELVPNRAPSLPPTPITLAPGKTYALPIKSLAVLNRNREGSAAYWLLPGEYVLTATYTTELLPTSEASAEALRGFRRVTLTAPVKLKVVEAKSQP